MSKPNRCQNGSQDCEFEGKHELALVSEIMRAIGSYSTKEDIDICPLCVRDTMLAVAALLHIEAAKIVSKGADMPPPRTKKLGDALAKAARSALEKVSLAKAALVSSYSRN